MAKYQGAYRNTLDDDDDKTYSEELAEQQPKEDVELDAEEKTFKQRYGDVRKHLSHMTNEKDKQIDALKAQLSQATQQQIKFPKTEQEIEAWTKKYPDVSAIVDTIARKRANEALQEGEKRIKSLQTMEKQMHKDKAEKQLNKLHPDFSEIRQDPKFHEWVSLQPIYIQDALYKNSTDAHAASRAIDLYKVDLSKAGKKKSKGAAESVNTRSSRTTTPTTQAGMKFSESQIESMSERDFDKFEDAIMESMQNGTFEYDISGAAR